MKKTILLIYSICALVIGSWFYAGQNIDNMCLILKIALHSIIFLWTAFGTVILLIMAMEKYIRKLKIKGQADQHSEDEGQIIRIILLICIMMPLIVAWMLLDTVWGDFALVIYLPVICAYLIYRMFMYHKKI